MNRWLYFAGGILTGAVTAGIAVYFLEKRSHEESMDTVLNSRVEEQLKRVHLEGDLESEKRKVEELLSAINIFCDDNTKNCIVDLVNNRLTVQKMTEAGFDEETISEHMIRHKYEQFVSLYTEDSPSEEARRLSSIYSDEFEQRTDETKEPSDFGPEPSPRGTGTCLITEDDYVRSDDEYDHQALMYYALDDTLTDEDDCILGQDIVGVDNLEEFSRTDNPAIFVRNEHLKIEYEIIWEDRGTYQSIILGVSDAPTCQRIFRNGDDE